MQTEGGQYAQSINQIMSAAFYILTYEKVRHPVHVLSSCSLIGW